MQLIEGLWIWVGSSQFQAERSFVSQEALHAYGSIFAITLIFKCAKKAGLQGQSQEINLSPLTSLGEWILAIFPFQDLDRILSDF